MADQQQPTEHHHHHVMDAKPDEKQQDDSAPEVKTLTNIFYDCLERIFDFMELGDMLRLAHTCKRLQVAVAAKYGDDFGETEVKMVLNGNGSIMKSPSVVEVFGLKNILPFLRCFGAKISKLHVDYDGANQPQIDYVDEYINKYCAKTLTWITFTNKSEYSAEKFRTPFENVKNVGIYCGRLGNQFSNFAIWFPNLRELAIIDQSIDEANTAVNFPNLLRVMMTNSCFNVKPDTISIASVKPLLQSNPQLISLITTTPRFTFTTLLDTISGNPAISNLICYCVLHDYHVSKAEVDRFISEHSSIKELIMPNCYFAPDDAVFLIRQLKSLRQLIFRNMNLKSDSDNLMAQLGNAWGAKIDDYFIVLEKQN